MVIKVVHTADNHLDPTPQRFRGKINERRKDFRTSFEEVLNFCYEKKVDLLLISGDLFDKVNPRNPARSNVMKWFRHLALNGTKIFLIGGNHDMPRSTEEAESPLLIFERSGYARFFSSIDEVETENLRIEDIDLSISGVSYNHTLDPSSNPLSSLKVPDEGDINIFMVHYSITGMKQKYPYISEPVIKISEIPSYIDYVAAGHLHKQEIKEIGKTKVAYPGSTEKLTFDEAEDEKGFLYLELNSNSSIYSSFIKVHTRPMRKILLEIDENREKNIQNYLTKEISSLKNKDLILKVEVRGSASIESLQHFNKSEIIRKFENEFFFFELDDSELLLRDENIEVNYINKSPIEIFYDYINQRLSKEKDEEKRKKIKDAIDYINSKLREVS